MLTLIYRVFIIIIIHKNYDWLNHKMIFKIFEKNINKQLFKQFTQNYALG